MPITYINIGIDGLYGAAFECTECPDHYHQTDSVEPVDWGCLVAVENQAIFHDVETQHQITHYSYPPYYPPEGQVIHESVHHHQHPERW